MIHPSLQQLKTLGYRAGDRVWIRCLAGKGFDVQTDRLYPFDGFLTLTEDGYNFTRMNPASKGGGEKFTVSDGIRYLTGQNARGYGSYLVVNAGGRKDEEIARCPALFFEIDGIPKDEQRSRLDRLPFPPSMVIETRNSLHCYYRTEGENPEGWRSLQKRLIQLMDSDPAIHNESRLMRLAGFAHQRKGLDPYPITIESLTGAIYSRFEFDQLLPPLDRERWPDEREKVSEEERRQRLESARQRRENLAPVDGFPIEICLSKDDRELITGGTGEGGRNRIGFKLASNLIATANWLDLAGYRYTGDPRSSFDEYADRCNPPINYRERDLIWKSASRGNPTPSLSDEAIENCIKAWQWKRLQTERRARQKEVEKTLPFWERLKRFAAAARKEKRKTPTPKPLPTPDKRLYDRGDRLNVWINGKHSILDLSPTGDGKSFDAGTSTLEMLGVDRIIYVTTDPRNVSTPTLKEWTVLEGRHNGLIRNEFGELRRRKKSDDYGKLDRFRERDLRPNCYRPWTHETLAEKNIPHGLESSTICRGCPHAEMCASGAGDYDYRHSRLLALISKRIIAHPSSLPTPLELDPVNGFDYTDTAIIWEESENSFNPRKTVTVSSDDLDKTIAALIGDEGLFSSLRPLLSRLKEIFEAKQPDRYGWDGKELKAELSRLVPDDLDIKAVKRLLAPDLDFLNPVAEYGESIEDLPAGTRKRFSEKDSTLSEKAEKIVLKQWLPEFIGSLRGTGYLSLDRGKLSLSFPDDRPRAIVRAAAKNIFLSATEHPENLKRRIGDKITALYSSDFLDTVATGDGLPDNIDFTQVTDLGRMGKNRGDAQKRRAKAILDHYRAIDPENTTVIRFQSHAKEDGDQESLHHFVHSQGTNAIAGKTRLIIDGLPCPNLESLKHDYACYTGNFPDEDSEDFKSYVHHRILSLLQQEIGRPRANLDPDRWFEIILLTDYDLSDLIPSERVRSIKAHELAPEAESAGERNKRLIGEAVDQLKAEGKEITQRAIARVSGLARETIRRLRDFLDELLRVATNAIDTLYSKCGHPPDPPEPLPDDAVFLAREYLPLAADGELLGEFETVLDTFPRRYWFGIWESIPAVTQEKLLSRLIDVCSTPRSISRLSPVS
jgi:hypothetical protein